MRISVYGLGLLSLLIICKIDLYFAWGAVAHKAVASIANTFIDEKASNGINEILAQYKGPNGKQFKNIVEISTYADEIKSLVSWANAYHYVNLEGNQTIYNPLIHCKSPQYCIVESLDNYTRTLRNPAIKDINLLGEALSFIVHFMGDIYQPLHVGNADDRGGNDIKLTFGTGWNVGSTKTSNLHSLWDTLLLTHFKNTQGYSDNDVLNVFVDYADSNKPLKDEYLSNKVDFYAVTKDSRDVVLKSIYNLYGIDYANLPSSYYTQSWPVKKLQIIKSGLKLAKLLNDIFAIRKTNNFIIAKMMANLR